MKPVVYLVDRDEEYVQFLEIRLIEKYGGGIELRTITDEEYFRQTFAAQRQAAAMLIAEELYTDALRQHKLERIVVLCSGGADPRPGERDRGVVRVDRFGDPRTILNEALFDLDTGAGGESTGVSGLARVITVTSAIGGSGKTSLALALARSLAKNHRRVLYLCTEQLQSFGCYLDEEGYLPAEACRVLARNTSGTYQRLRPWMRRQGFSYLPAMYSSPEAMQIPADAYVRLVREAKMSGELDAVILDTGVGCDGEKSAFLAESDQVIVLVQQDAASVAKTDALLRNMDAGSGKYRFVCNRYDEQRENCIPRKAAEHYTVNTYVAEREDASLESLAADAGLAELTYMLL